MQNAANPFGSAAFFRFIFESDIDLLGHTGLLSGEGGVDDLHDAQRLIGTDDQLGSALHHAHDVAVVIAPIHLHIGDLQRIGGLRRTGGHGAGRAGGGVNDVIAPCHLRIRLALDDTAHFHIPFEYLEDLCGPLSTDNFLELTDVAGKIRKLWARIYESLKLLDQLESSLQNSMNIKKEQWKHLVYDYQLNP